MKLISEGKEREHEEREEKRRRKKEKRRRRNVCLNNQVPKIAFLWRVYFFEHF